MKKGIKSILSISLCAAFCLLLAGCSSAAAGSKASASVQGPGTVQISTQEPAAAQGPGVSQTAVQDSGTSQVSAQEPAKVQGTGTSQTTPQESAAVQNSGTTLAASQGPGAAQITDKDERTIQETTAAASQAAQSMAAQEEAEMTLRMKIGDTPVEVNWEENESVETLKTLCQEKPLSIQMSMYGGFEQVGPIGKSLPRSDKQTTTQAGDIVLYSGNQVVVFYGSNSWAYTRLGHITDKSAQEMAQLLGNGDVTITFEFGR